MTVIIDMLELWLLVMCIAASLWTLVGSNSVKNSTQLLLLYIAICKLSKGAFGSNYGMGLE